MTITPVTLASRGSAERTIARYWAAHNRAFPERGASDYVIPHHVLRDYLDVMWAARHRNGLHNVTITITRNPALGLIHPDILLESEISIRVEGQKWLT